jgi:O-antigen ligase
MNSPPDSWFVADLREASRFLRTKGALGQKFAWFIFAATCLQLTFLTPYFVLLPGERANIFSSLLCAVSLVCAVMFTPARKAKIATPEILMSIGLSAFMVISSVSSPIPESSSARAFTILASGLGGFWCARLLLGEESRRRQFRLLCLIALAGLIVVCLFCYYRYGDIFQCVDSNPHPLACRMLLLWFAPLSLVIMVNRPAWLTFSVLIGGSYAVFFLSDLRSACLIPLVLLLIAGGMRVLKLKYLLALIILLSLLLAVFFLRLPEAKIGKHYEPAYYRFESYFFAIHVAKQHPWFGIGLRAPKDQFLDNYEIKYPYVTKERFTESLQRIVTSENTFVSFMVDVGFPFTLLYIFSLIVLLKRLIKQFRRPEDAILFHPMVLLLPIVAGLLHFQVLDGLYHPQVSWFFHILLGMIPPNSSNSAAPGA